MFANARLAPMIVIDGLHPDGSRQAVSPNLDALVRGGAPQRRGGIEAAVAKESVAL